MSTAHPSIDACRTDDGSGSWPSWQLLDRFVLRSPGFPFDWLSRLRFTRSAAAARRVLAARAHLRESRERFERDIFTQLCDEETAAGRDKATFRFWYQLARTIRQGRLVAPEVITAVREQHDRPGLADWLAGWQDAVGELAAVTRQGEAVFQDELAERRQALRDLVSEPRFQEALWLSNPAMFETGWPYFERHWHPQQRPAKIKHLERRFYAYLQRFCAKNDTAGFFGPLNYGTFGEQPGLRYERAPVQIRRRAVFFAYWAAEALAQRIAAEPEVRPYLKPRRSPTRGARGDLGALATVIDGRRSVAELAQALDVAPDALLHDLERLAERGLVQLDLPIPPATLHPLDYLAGCLAAIPASAARDRWLGALGEFQRICARFAEADLVARRELLVQADQHYIALTGMPARRGAGQMFQDRVLLYEECLGAVETLALGPEMRQRICAGLAPIATFCQCYSEQQRHDLRLAAGALLDELGRDRAEVPLVQFVAAWRRRFPSLPATPRADALQERFAGLVAQRSEGSISRITAAELLDLCEPPDQPGLLSPDLLLAAGSPAALARGDYQLVIGELHHGVQPAGWMTSFVDDPQDWEQAIHACLPEPTAAETPANLLFGRRMKCAPPEFPGPVVRASAVAGHGQGWDLAALVIRRCGDELRLCAPGHAPGLCFYPPSYGVPAPLYAPFTCFSYPLAQQVPVRCGAHTPRIEIDGVVYQRERWDVPTSELPGADHRGTAFELMIAYAELQRRLDLPDHMFVRTAGEPKPVYIDFTNYFALELLAHLVSQNDTITLAEMWPGPEHLWLQGEEGSYCCELRTVVSNARET